MIKLKDIIQNIDVIESAGDISISVTSLEMDSRLLIEGALFVAVKGISSDGHLFIDQAIQKGAKAVICEKIPQQRDENVTYVSIQNTSKFLGKIAGNYYGNPSSKIRLVGVTGTNGKTTVASWLYQIFKEAGYKVGLISTVRNIVDEKILEATHTTPDVISLNRLLSRMVSCGCEFCFMEVSSHAIHQQRISELFYEGAVFTNVSHDHLDYHGTFKEYIMVKKAFFDTLPEDAFALTNVDDKNGALMLQNTSAKKIRYASGKMAEYTGKIIEQHVHGMLVHINHKELWTKCIGEFNLYNLLAVYGAAVELGLKPEEVLVLLSKLKPVEGRFENVYSDKGITAIVDYAHTPDALKNVLQTIKQIVKQGNRIITVAGAGGNRDKEKRPKMAAVAAELSDIVILTSDNPRDEKPEDIIMQMEAGVISEKKKQVFSVTDRKEAIKVAVQMADQGDVVLIAGKGHEHYQEIKGVKHPFNDKKVVEEILQTTI